MFIQVFSVTKGSWAISWQNFDKFVPNLPNFRQLDSADLGQICVTPLLALPFLLCLFLPHFVPTPISYLMSGRPLMCTIYTLFRKSKVHRSLWMQSYVVSNKDSIRTTLFSFCGQVYDNSIKTYCSTRLHGILKPFSVMNFTSCGNINFLILSDMFTLFPDYWMNSSKECLICYN